MGKWSAPTYERRRLAKLELQLAPETHTLTVETQSIETCFLTRRKKKFPLAKRDSCCICEVQFIEQTHLFSFCHPLSLAPFLYLLSFISVAPFLSIRLYPSLSLSLSFGFFIFYICDSLKLSFSNPLPFFIVIFHSLNYSFAIPLHLPFLLFYTPFLHMQ